MNSIRRCKFALLSLLMIGGNADALDPPPLITCGCEHTGSPSDGTCEVMVIPSVDAWGQPLVVDYLWTPFGSAWMPYGFDQSGGAYYDSVIGIGGGLNVNVIYRRTSGFDKNLFALESVQKTCHGGTVGSGG